MLHETGVGTRATTVREVVLVIRRKMRSPARAVSHRQRIPVHRSKNSRSRLTRLKARLLSQAPLSSARTSENASRSLLHSRQPQSKTNLHHSSRRPQSKTSNLRGPPRPSKTRLPSLLMHRRVRVKARAAGRAARRRTNAISERITPSTPLLDAFTNKLKKLRGRSEWRTGGARSNSREVTQPL